MSKPSQRDHPPILCKAGLCGLPSSALLASDGGRKKAVRRRMRRGESFVIGEMKEADVLGQYGLQLPPTYTWRRPTTLIPLVSRAGPVHSPTKFGQFSASAATKLVD